VLATRLANQKLASTTFRRAADVVAWMGAVQAQDYYGAKWGLGLRAHGLTDAAVDRAFDAGAILRTHVLRPTWHFVTPADIRWMLALTGPRIQAVNRGYARSLGLTDRDLTRGRVAVERALEGGHHLTRSELSVILRKSRIDATGQRLAHLMMDFELAAAVCSGPRRGKLFTYALLDERVPMVPAITRDEALAALTRRYFRSHGPATRHDFAWWSGLTLRDAKMGTEMSRVDVLASAPLPERVAGATHLLPNYDEYLIAYKDRGATIDLSRKRNLGIFSSAEFPHHVVVDGRVAGSWRRLARAAEADVIVAPYRALTTRETAQVRRAAERYADFMGLRAALSWR
jgi:hypothetical protein